MVGLVETVTNFTIHLIENMGYWGVFAGMMLESACIPLPSEIIMPLSGYVAYEGKMTLLGITLIGTLGNLAGSLIAYLVGLKGGRPFLQEYGRYVFITQRRLEMADWWFEKYGDKAVFISRLIPIIRTFISLPAGITRMDLKKFVIYTFIGSLTWTFALGYLGFRLGHDWEIIRNYFHILDIFVVLGVLTVTTYGLYKYRNEICSKIFI